MKQSQLCQVALLCCLLGNIRLMAQNPETVEIVATSNFRWKVSQDTLSVGDTLIYKLTDTPNGHPFGLEFKKWDKIQDALEIETVMGQQPFDASVGKSTESTDIPGKILLRAKIKKVPEIENPQESPSLKFACLIHCAMTATLDFDGTTPTPAKVVEGTNDNKWSPDELKVKVGDIVEWKVTGSKHGVAFNDGDKAKQVLEFLDGFEVKAQEGFNAPIEATHKQFEGITKDESEGLLIRAKVKAIPAGMTELPYFCTLHGMNMKGKLVLETNVPKVVEGTNDNKWSPDELKVKVGDIVEWKVTGSKHGVAFNDGDKAKQVLEFLDGFEVKAQEGFNAPIEATHKQFEGITKDESEGLLIRAKVKAIPAGMTELPYFCTLHGMNMKGKLVLETNAP